MSTKWNTVDVYSIDTKVTNIDGSHELLKRTEKPVSLREALRVCAELEEAQHVVELRKAS
jgi:hypothetical protein